LKPYYEQGDITIYHADCRDVLPTLEAGSVDLVLTDPPYGINFSAEGYDRHNAKHGTAAVRVTAPMANDDGSLDLGFLTAYPRRIVWGYPYLQDPEAKGWFVWIKHESNSLQPMGNPLEMAYTTCWNGFKWKARLWCGYLTSGEQRLAHPTQKPLSIISWMVANFSDDNALILDPFMGSGTTLVAAKALGRRAIGIEIEERYCEIAAKRLQQMVLPLEVSDANS